VHVLKKTAVAARQGDPTWLLVALAGLVFLLHSYLFRDYLLDDAGISFVYARNLAAGHGLVSQPGVLPVEGYSNFLWVLLLAPFFRLGLFEPTITPKAVSMVLVLLAFVLVYRTLAPLTIRRSQWLVGLGLVLLALNTAFTAWATAGLENPLYTLLLCLMLWVAIRGIVRGHMGPGTALLAGLLACALAMTRPDGIVFAAAYPVLLLTRLLERSPRVRRAGPVLLHLLVYLAALAVSVGGFIAFRLLYFHDLLPNTYYVKGGTILQDAGALLLLQPALAARISSLTFCVAGPLGNLVLAGLLVITLYLLFTGRFQRGHLVLGIFLLLAMADYLLLPPDPFVESRFATPFVLFFYLYGLTIAATFVASWPWKRAVKMRLGVIALGLFLGMSTVLFSLRSLDFAQHPVLSFAQVTEEYGLRFNHYADQLGLEQGSILLPDVGGTLYYSRLRVYDLGGLTDRTIARTLFYQKDPAAFYNYVFETARPTFIHTHTLWAYQSNLAGDPRFGRDYVVIQQAVDPWIQAQYGLEMYSGTYVRKDVLGDRLELLQTLSP
jgi:hypothetical protein